MYCSISPKCIVQFHQNLNFQIGSAVFSLTECFQTKKLSCEMMHFFALTLIILKKYNATMEKNPNSMSNKNILLPLLVK